MKSLVKLILAAVLLSVQPGIGQVMIKRAALLDYAKHLQQKALADKAEALRAAGRYGLPVRIDQDGKTAELQSVSGGKLFYFLTNNATAAKTISTSKVQPAGGYFNLTGSNQTLGEWDAGRVRREHQEFPNSRVTQKDDASSNHSHSTHVACTMVGAGVQSAALGMSYGGKLDAYDWNSDMYEMATAAANGLKVSNHSYGYVTGWYWGNMGAGSGWYWMGDPDVCTYEDVSYGRYDEYAQGADSVASLAQNYLICWAAGNDRGYGPNAGAGHYYWNSSANQWTWSTASRDKSGGAAGYDCISHVGLGKNIVTCAAVQGIPGSWTKASDVVMSSFSGWGPADDGRIKPDISACGVNVYSAVADGDQSYAYSNGTSMATPNVSGSIGLLLQHQANLNKPAMLSSTMKGLIIHTADEAGAADGPDYSFGWGLMNTLKAAQLMSLNASRNSNFDIQELTLVQYGTISQEIYCDGTQPLKATIAWIDPPGRIASYALDPTDTELVNDLDLRIIRKSDNTNFYPWKLNKDNPSAAATKGDNAVDNVEQALVSNPAKGVYIVKITHKGQLRDGLSQKVSLLLSGATNSYIVTQNAPSQVCAGASFNLAYEIGGTFAEGNQFIAQLSDASGSFASPTQIGSVTSTTALSVTASIPVGTLAGAGYKVRVVSTNPALVGAESAATTTVNSLPVPMINGPSAACQFDRISFICATQAGASYNWSAANASIDGPSNGAAIYLRVNNAGIATVKLVQTNASGCVDSIVKTITVNPQPSVALAGETDVCGSKSYSYSASGSGSYAWSVTGGSINGTTTGSTVNVTWAGQGQGSIKVILTNSNGCKDTAVANITIHTMTAPEITGALVACEKKEEKYSSNLAQGLTAKWTVEGGVINGPDNGSSVNVIWGTTGFAMVQLKYVNAFGCVDSVRKGVIINELPTPTIAGDAKICIGSVRDYTANVIEEGKYKWAAFGGTIIGSDSAQTVKVEWTEPGNCIVRLIETNRHGCSVTTVKSVETLAPAKTTITGAGVACANKEFSYVADLKNINSATWSVDGGSITNVSEDKATATVLWGAAGVGKVKLAIVNSAGCDGSVERSIAIEGVANQSIAGKTIVCRDGEEEYSAPKMTGYAYEWIAEGGEIVGPNNSNKARIHWTENTGTLTLRTKSAGGCESEVTIDIQTDLNRDINITGPATVCSGAPVNYKLDSALTAKWKATGGSVVGADEVADVKVVWTSPAGGTLEATYTVNGSCYHTSTYQVAVEQKVDVAITAMDEYCVNSGSYALTGSPAGGKFHGEAITNGKFDTDNNPAGSYEVTYVYASELGCAYSATKTITILDQPAKPTISVQDKILVCDQDAARYQWSLVSAEIPGATQKTYEPTKSGNYTVKTWNDKNCVSPASDTLHFTYVSASDPSEEADLKAYPSPAKDELYIEVGESFARSEIALTDNLGRTLLVAKANGNKRIKLDVSPFASGVYFVRINAGGKTIARAVIIGD